MGRAIRRGWPTALLLWVCTSVGALASPEAMELTLRATGATPIDFHAEQAQDSMHSCALLGPPNAEQTLVLTFNASQSQMLLPPSEFGFSLSIAGKVGAPWTEKQPTAILQASIGRVVFLGLHASDPAFRLEVNVDPGGGSGSFSATHLRETGNGRTIDVKGSWRCFQEAAAAPQETQDTAGSPPPPPATAAGPEAGPAPEARSPSRTEQHFRIFHSDACQGADCAIWTVIETASGKTFAAAVSLKALKLPRWLRERAQAGQVQLWITGEQTKPSTGHPVVTARRLEGVAPRNGDRKP